MKMKISIIFLILLAIISACTIAPAPIPTTVPTLAPTATFTPRPTPTKNLYQFNGYWVSPIKGDTNAFIATYGNVCEEYINKTDLNCIENWKGEKGKYPKDYKEIRVHPYHLFGWDFRWEKQGLDVYAVQGGQIKEITLEDNSSIGVHFFIIDKNWNCADYGHIDVNSLVERELISKNDRLSILNGQIVDGGSIMEGELIGITGDDCCPFGVLHISTCYDLWGIDPGTLWEKGEFPIFNEEYDPILDIP